jgi:KaiC/GvpD/RAD55 family RecA-like ATPase
MDDRSDSTAVQVDPFPEHLGRGSTVLVASAGDPTRHAVSLRILCAQGDAGDTALVVTTTESADRTIAVYETIDDATERPSLGIVDTTSEHQSISAPYGETPVVFTPSPGDHERLVMALSELSQRTRPTSGARHLVVRSLTPILEASSATRVRTVFERITGLRSETGLGLLGIDYTAHDEATIETVADLVDGVLWVTHPDPSRLAFDYQPTRGRHSGSEPDGDTGA